MHKEHDFPAVMIRPFNTYGPNITQPYIIPEIVMQILGKNSKIHLGNINAERDFTFVSDTANGIIQALFSKKAIGETINLGSGKSHKIKNIVKSVSSILEKKVTITSNKDRLRPFDVNKLVCDNRKAKKILDWEPKITFDEGLKNTIGWIKENNIELRTPFRGWPKQYRKIRK
jgi:dTDP-glucose 4,6-dehydratase